MALNLGPTLYELQLANQQARTQRALQERDKSRAYEQQQVQGLIEQDRWNEEKKQGEFNRKIKLAEMGGQGAALAGQPTPQFADPVVQEHADMASFLGQGESKKQAAAADIAKEKLSQERFLKSMGWQSQADIAEANRKAAAQRGVDDRAFRAGESAKDRASRLRAAEIKAESKPTAQYSPKEMVQLEHSLRGDLRMEPAYKDMPALQAAYAGIMNAGENAYGARVAMSKFLKTLDPSSVISPGEALDFQNAPGVPAKIRNMWNATLGGGNINPKLMAELRGELQKLYLQARSQHDAVTKSYTELAVRSGLRPENVVLDRGITNDVGGSSGAQAAPGPNAPPNDPLNLTGDDEEE